MNDGIFMVALCQVKQHNDSKKRHPELLLFFLFLSGLLAIGCTKTSVDISNLSTQTELDKYVGKKVSFTGIYQNTKQLSISNGKISLEIYRNGSHSLNQQTTIVGILRKETIPVVESDASNEFSQTPQPQPPSPGIKYIIE
jgi:hypothetical protein